MDFARRNRCLIKLHAVFAHSLVEARDSDWSRQKLVKFYRCGLINKEGNLITLTQRGMKAMNSVMEYTEPSVNPTGHGKAELTHDEKAILKKIMEEGLTTSPVNRNITSNALSYYKNYNDPKELANSRDYPLGHMLFYTTFGFKDGVLTVKPEVEMFRAKTYKREASLGKCVLKLDWCLTDMHWDRREKTLDYCIYKADNKRSKRGTSFELMFRGERMTANFADATYALKHHKKELLEVIKRATPPEIQIAFADAVLGGTSSVRDLI